MGSTPYTGESKYEFKYLYCVNKNEHVNVLNFNRISSHLYNVSTAKGRFSNLMVYY